MRRRAKGLIVIAALLAFFGVGGTALADATPALTIDPPTEIGYTAAHFSGTVDPEGGPGPILWHFEYSSEPASPWSWGWAGFGEISGAEAEGTTPIAVKAGAEWLQAGTEYSVRLVTMNGSWENTAQSETLTFTTQDTTPPAVSIDPPGAATGTTAAVSGSVNPEAPAGNPSAFDVNWNFSCVPACGFAGGYVPADSSWHPVAQTLEGLEPNTHYEVNLVASNAGSSASAGPVSFDTAPVPPQVKAQYAEVEGSSATLSGEVDPGNSTVTYQFEWGTDTSYGNVTPASPQAVGAVDSSFHQVSQQLNGLQSGTAYHYRLAATNTETSVTAYGADRVFETPAPAVTEAACPNAELRQGLSALLPNCRAYEFVTPPNKLLDFQEHPTSTGATDDGAHLFFRASQALVDSAGAWPVTYRADRSSTGWTTVSPDPKPLVGAGLTLQGFTSDLSTIESTVRSYSPEDEDSDGSTGSGTDVYRIGADGSVSFLSKGDLNPRGVFNNNVEAVAATADGSHILMTSEKPLLTADEARGFFNGVGLYDAAPDGLHLVGVDNNGEAINHQGVSLGSGSSSQHALSSDGSTVYFTAGSAGLFARLNDETTVPIPPAPVGANALAQFANASPDGTKVFFVTPEALTPDDEDELPDLYQYNRTNGNVTLISATPPGYDGSVNPYGVLASEDSSRIYFMAEGELLPGEGSPGTTSTYLWNNGTLKFVAPVAVLGSERCGSSVITPDGRSLLFESTSALTAGDTDSADDVYVYDAVSGSLVRVSKGPAGGNGPADSRINPSVGSGETLGSSCSSQFLNPSHPISDDGRFVFFQSSEALVERDTNRALDVYEYDRARHETRLLSSGTSSASSYYDTSTASGKDVFITTTDRLVSSDTDNLRDMYDVRIGGGFPQPPAAAPPCDEGNCQGQPHGAPAAVAAGTEALHAAKRQEHRHRRKGRRRRKSHHRRHHVTGRSGK